jgi:hypothetical protein
MRFAPKWTLDANVDSNINLNSEFLTSRPVGYFEPLDPAILTQPGWAWANAFLTPGASIPVGAPLAGSQPNTAIPTVSETTPTIMGTLPPTSTGTTIPTNTLVWIPLPATKTPRPRDTDLPPPATTAVNTSPPPSPEADLGITNTDGGDLYEPGVLRSYTVTVSNPIGPDPVTGATVSDVFSGPVASITWSCSASGTTCPALSGNDAIDDLVNLPVGSSITYTVNVLTTSPASADLESIASVTRTGLTDPGPLPNQAPDTNTALIYSSPPPELGTAGCVDRWDFDCTYEMASGDVITFTILPITDAAGPDLVYYERPTHLNTIEMDFVQIEISDGYNWYTVFYWGGGVIANTNIGGYSENDNEMIPFTSLYPYPGTGITIDIAGLTGTASGPFRYLRVTAPSSDDGDGIAIDAILPYP